MQYIKCINIFAEQHYFGYVYGGGEGYWIGAQIFLGHSHLSASAYGLLSSPTWELGREVVAGPADCHPPWTLAAGTIVAN